MTKEDLLALPFRDLLKALHTTQAELHRRWGIPLRTMSHWVNGDRECPPYLKQMLIDLLTEKTEC